MSRFPIRHDVDRSLRALLLIVVALGVPGSSHAVTGQLRQWITGTNAKDHLGAAVAGIGDFNGDLRPDFAVAATRADLDSVVDAGRVEIYYGRSPCLALIPDLTLTQGPGPFDSFGYALSAGDVNGDGRPDLVVGAPTAASLAGRVYVYFGGPGVDAIADLTLEGEAPENLFGNSVAVVDDVNGDGEKDIVVGAPFNDAGGYDAGRVYLYFGGESIDADPDRVFTGSGASAYLGMAVAGAGNLDGDPYGDLLLHASGDGVVPSRTYVFLGGDPPDLVADRTLTAQTSRSIVGSGDLDGDTYPDVVVGASVYFGGPEMDDIADLTLAASPVQSLAAAGDVDDDGWMDLLVGTSVVFPMPVRGRAHVYRGGPGIIDGTPDLILDAEVPDDAYGSRVAGLDDLDGDGSIELAVGALANDAGGTDAGRAYVYSCGPIATPCYFTIGASALGGGSIEPSGSVRVLRGQNQAFGITPNPCFVLTQLRADGIAVTPATNYTFTNVQANHTLAATFMKGSAAPPPRLQAWWSFDHSPSPGVMSDLAHFNSGINRGTLLGAAPLVAGKVGQAMRCVSGTAGMRVQSSNSSIFIGGCGFGIDAWIRLFPGSPAGAMRHIFYVSSSYSFHVKDGQLGLGSILASMVPLSSGVWHHVAVTSHGGSCGGTPQAQTSFYVDGVRVATIPQHLSANSSLAYVGRNNAGDAPFNGDIDEVDVFRSSTQGAKADSAVIRKVWAAGCSGKRQEFVRLPEYANLGSTSRLCAVITNVTSASQSYSWTASSGTCFNIAISPASGTRTIPAYATDMVPLILTRLGGSPVCFVRMDVTNTTNPNAFFTESNVGIQNSVQVNATGCLIPTVAGASMPTAPDLQRAASSAARFTVVNEGAEAVAFAYRIDAVDGDTQEPSEDITLDGLPFGVPDTGSILVPPQDSVEIAVDVQVDFDSPFRTDQVILSADLDGDTILEPLAASPVLGAEDETAPILATGLPPNEGAELAVFPNPFRGLAALRFTLPETGDATVAVFDLSGRRVRTLHTGPLQRGMHRLDWDGRSASGGRVGSGVYWVRVEAAGAVRAIRIVHLR